MKRTRNRSGKIHWSVKTAAAVGLLIGLLIASFAMLKTAGESSPPADTENISVIGEEAIVDATSEIGESAQSSQEGPPSPPVFVKAETATPGGIPVMPGASLGDIKHGLEKWGLEFADPEEIKGKDGREDLYLDKGVGAALDTKVVLSCNIISTPELQIASARFKVDGLDVADSLSPGKYLAVAEGFLGYCAALPYDGAEPLKAKLWIKDNIGKVKPGEPVKTVIGSVEYQLSADKYTRLLTVRPKK